MEGDVMPGLVDPAIGLKSFQQELKKGGIKPKRCTSAPSLFVETDSPDPSVLRITFAFVNNKRTPAYAVFILVEPINGVPCWGLGYATDERARNKGHAVKIVNAGLQELKTICKRLYPGQGFYVEAIVGRDNEASQKVAERTLGGDPEEIVDDETRVPAYYYLKHFPVE
ncbi:MAG: GNAT family N-acetyltransferase [Oceanospirillaceae bacterium]|jgi:RimJ/RimL family protein N-acetyltransferase|nr:GNAT family N-acetyltransferase [Oceanospirillaceae bacterium]|tara:strand:+ start:2054 stop:2560 length:507 start_codon:yes stop_codon:yes gene_type:complete